MRSIILALLFTLVFSSVSFAQFSAKAGINLARLSSPNSFSTFNGGRKLGILLGVNYNHLLSESVSFRSGIQYSAKGNSVNFISVDFSTSLGYLEVPMDFVYTTGRLSVHTGPYLGYLLTASIPDQKIKDDMALVDFGFNVGVSVQFGDLGIGINYGFGLVNTNKLILSGGSIRNKVLGVYLTYTQL